MKPKKCNQTCDPVHNPQTLVPDTEDEEESSFVEGPKPTDEERNKISDDVGKAIVENYTELEELKKKKDETKTNGHAKSDNVDGAVSSKKEGTDPTGVIKAEKMDVDPKIKSNFTSSFPTAEFFPFFTSLAHNPLQ